MKLEGVATPLCVFVSQKITQKDAKVQASILLEHGFELNKAGNHFTNGPNSFF